MMCPIRPLVAFALLVLAGSLRAAEDRQYRAPTEAWVFQTASELAAGTETDAPRVSPPIDGQEAIAQGVALAASGRPTEARELFAAVAAGDDSPLAALAHYNLGCLAARQAQELFGTPPEELSAAQCEEGLALLAQACEHFRQCLRLDPQHADARHNLELIRLWIGANRGLWQKVAKAPPSMAASPKPAAGPPGKVKPIAGPSGPSGQTQQAGSAPPTLPEKTAPTPQAKAPAGEPSTPQSGPADPLRQYAEDLMAKVRQRIQDRRQREQSRLLPRWTQAAEKDW